MNLYNRKSFISAAPEGRPPSSRNSSVTQWIYFLIVIVLFGYLLYLLFKPYYMIEANGLVDVEVKEVIAERSGVLDEIYVAINQPFSKGDLLARIAPEKHCLAEDDTQLEKLAYDMDVLNTDIRTLQQEQGYFSALLKPATGMLRALEVNASLFKEQQKEQQSVQHTVNKLGLDIQRAKAKLAIMISRRDSLQLAQQSRPLVPDCLMKDVLAFEDGLVTDIRVLAQAYAEKGRPILNYSPTDATVRVIFLASADLYESFSKQPQLVVIFPDGIESLARIDRIESTATQNNGNLNDLLGRDKVSLKIVLVPADTADNGLWRAYERLPVSIRGVR